MTVLDRVQAMLGRIDYLLTYALVGFVRRVVTRYFAARDTIYIAVVLVTLTSCIHDGTHPLRKTVQSVHKVSAVLLTDMIMASIPTPSLTDTNLYTVVLSWVLSTAAVVLLPTLLTPLTAVDVAGQISSLVLFMYAENSVFLVWDPTVDLVLPGVALLVLYAAHRRMPQTQAVEHVVLQAMSMLVTNIIVSTVMDVKGTATDDSIAIAWLICTLVLFENVQQWAELATELKDYATWKAAGLLSARLQFNGVEDQTVLAFVLLMTVAAHVFQLGLRQFHSELWYNAIVELGVIVIVNTVLGSVQKHLATTPPQLVWIILLSFVNVIHLVLEAFTRH